MLFHDVEHDADNVLSSHFVSHLASYTVDLRRVAGNSSVFICLIQERHGQIWKSRLLGRIFYRIEVTLGSRWPCHWRTSEDVTVEVRLCFGRITISEQVASWVQSSGERISQVRIHFDGRLEKGIIGQVAIVWCNKVSDALAPNIDESIIQAMLATEHRGSRDTSPSSTYGSKVSTNTASSSASSKISNTRPKRHLRAPAHSYFVTSSSIVFGSQTDCANVIAILHQCHQPIGPSSESVTWSEGSSIRTLDQQYTSFVSELPFSAVALELLSLTAGNHAKQPLSVLDDYEQVRREQSRKPHTVSGLLNIT
ncbi:hypothetical protein KC320_g32 [Hortaea werneckii]|nr:hypothetical protein KC320_g32 [Hortaea werneckii]